MTDISTNKLEDTLNVYSKQINTIEKTVDTISNNKTVSDSKRTLNDYINGIKKTNFDESLSSQITGSANNLVTAAKLNCLASILKFIKINYIDIAISSIYFISFYLHWNQRQNLLDVTTLFNKTNELKSIKRRFTRALKVIKLNKITAKHKIAKISSISLLALSLIAAVSSMPILISTTLLSMGLISIIFTKQFSKNIDSKYKKISKLQRKTKFDFDYRLYSNTLFYMKIKAPNQLA